MPHPPQIPLLPDATRRLAAVDLDWDHVRAVDILAVLRSFVPQGGAIQRVVVYPSGALGRGGRPKLAMGGPLQGTRPGGNVGGAVGFFSPPAGVFSPGGGWGSEGAARGGGGRRLPDTGGSSAEGGACTCLHQLRRCALPCLLMRPNGAAPCSLGVEACFVPLLSTAADYGLERMAKEAAMGPQGIFKPAAPKGGSKRQGKGGTAAAAQGSDGEEEEEAEEVREEGMSSDDDDEGAEGGSASESGERVGAVSWGCVVLVRHKA